MSKYKTTKRTMKESYDRIAKVGYCDLQWLLKFQDPFAYSTRAEGWACDYYDIDDILISTGYAPIGNKRTKCSRDICRKYDNEAHDILDDESLSYEEKEEKVNNLLRLFITLI